MAQVYFNGLDANGLNQLWVTDGTTGHTVQIATPGASANGLNPQEIVTIGSLIFFQGQDANDVSRLWISDGTSGGTKPVIVNGANDGGLLPTNITAFGTGALFSGADTTGARQLWFSNGTTAGTINLSAQLAIPGGPDPVLITATGLKAVFNGLSSTGQPQLFVTDGTTGGTLALAVGQASGTGLNPTDITRFGSGALFFGNDTDNSSGLWITDGTAAGTIELAANVGTGPTSTGLTVLGTLALFNGGNNQLAVTDGTAAGTRLLNVPGASPTGLTPTDITVIGTRAVFGGLRADGSAGLWITDGTESNTIELLPAGASMTGLDPQFITTFGARALFSGVDASGVRQLWVTDGTALGTVVLAASDSNPAIGLQPRNITVFGSMAVFEGLQADGDDQLFVTDGTSGGTVSIEPAGSADIGLVPSYFAPGPVTAPAIPVISIAADAASKPEGNTGSTPFTFTLTRTGDLTGASQVAYAVSGADAADFAGGVRPTGTATFAAGSATAQITVNVAGDTVVEADETFTVTLSSPVNATLATATASSTILNDDVVAPSLTISAGQSSKPEGNAGATPFTFTVTRVGDTSGAVSVNYAVSGAVDANDFAAGTPLSGTVAFAAGETSKTITLNVAGDTVVEPDESFTVTLSNPVGATISQGTASSTIVNDDTSVSIAANQASKAEGNTGSTPFVFTLNRTGALGGVTTVNYAVTSSTATASDFTGGVLPSGSVTFNANETSKQITINVAGDTLVEADESFTVTLSNPAGATLGTATASSTILNDDVVAPSLSIVAGQASKAEGNAGPTPFTFTVSRVGDTSGAVSVSYAVSGAVDANDFAAGTPLSGTVAFAAGETSKTITLNVAGDTVVEPDESFTVTLSSPVGATISQGTASSTIVNDDTSVSIAANQASKAEGNSGSTPFLFTLNRTGALGGVTTVNYAVTSSTATASDFTGGVLPSGSVTFNANETSKQITINVAGDTVVEADESFTVTLSNPAGATLGTATASSTIVNDDASVSIATSQASKAEGNTGSTPFLFTVNRTGALGGVTTVNYAVTSSTATASDFTGGVLPSGSVTFNANETSKQITINVAGDTVVEADETFTVTLSNPAGATLGTATASSTILNDDVVAPGPLVLTPTAIVTTTTKPVSKLVTVASFTSPSAVTLDLLTKPTGGSVKVSGNTVVYTPASATKYDTFTYDIRNQSGSVSPVATAIYGDDTARTVRGASGGYTSVILGNGNDKVTLAGSYNAVLLGNGANTISGSAGNTTITTGNGGSTISLAGSKNKVTTGSGQDKVSFTDSGGDNNAITLGAGNDVLTACLGDSNTVAAGDGNDGLALSAGNNNQIDLAAGNDGLLGSFGDGNTILGGAGDDGLAILAGNNNVVDLGADCDGLTGAFGNSNRILGGDGNDVIAIEAGNANQIDLGSGDNSFTGKLGNANTLTGGDGNNNVTLNAIGTGNTITLGRGTDTVSAKNSVTNTFKLGDGNATLTLTGGRQNTVQLGVGSATVNGGTGDTISLLGSGGKLALYGASETVFLGPGKDQITADVGGAGLTAKIAAFPTGSNALGADTITNAGAKAGSFVNLVFAPTQTYTAALGRGGDTVINFGAGSSVDMIGFASVAVNGVVLHLS